MERNLFRYAAADLWAAVLCVIATYLGPKAQNHRVLSERSGAYKWRLVRKAVAPAFSTANLK